MSPENTAGGTENRWLNQAIGVRPGNFSHERLS